MRFAYDGFEPTGIDEKTGIKAALSLDPGDAGAIATRVAAAGHPLAPLGVQPFDPREPWSPKSIP